MNREQIDAFATSLRAKVDDLAEQYGPLFNHNRRCCIITLKTHHGQFMAGVFYADQGVVDLSRDRVGPRFQVSVVAAKPKAAGPKATIHVVCHGTGASYDGQRCESDGDDENAREWPRRMLDQMLLFDHGKAHSFTEKCKMLGFDLIERHSFEAAKAHFPWGNNPAGSIQLALEFGPLGERICTSGVRADMKAATHALVVAADVECYPSEARRMGTGAERVLPVEDPASDARFMVDKLSVFAGGYVDVCVQKDRGEGVTIYIPKVMSVTEKDYKSARKAFVEAMQARHRAISDLATLARRERGGVGVGSSTP